MTRMRQKETSKHLHQKSGGSRGGQPDRQGYGSVSASGTTGKGASSIEELGKDTATVSYWWDDGKQYDETKVSRTLLAPNYDDG